MTRKIAAFFDLDGTLLTKNSGSLWMKRERRLKRISFWQMLNATSFLLAYRFRAVVDMEAGLMQALRTVRGEREALLQRWTREWFYDEVVPYTAPGAFDVLDWHRQQGHQLVLLTSSSPYESAVACEHFRLDTYLCTRYEVQEGKLTGKVIQPICYGDGKVTVAERFGEASRLDLDNSYFYSDSFSDVPMMRRVKNPRAVNPDLRLRRTAQHQGWPILNWR